MTAIHKASSHGITPWREDPHQDLAANHERLLARIDLDSYMETLTENGTHPKIMVIACTDYRVGVNALFRLGPGQAFVQKPVGGFVIRDLENDPGFHSTFAVAAGIKHVDNIILMSHSDCAAAKVAQKYSEFNMITDDKSDAPYLRIIQKYVAKVSDRLTTYSVMFNEIASRGGRVPASDMMALQLGIDSYWNFMNARLYRNMTAKVADEVAAGNVCVTQLHFDLGEKNQHGDYTRLPALLRYYPEKNRHTVLKIYTKAEADLIIPDHYRCDCGNAQPHNHVAAAPAAPA